jgi:signal transduction histidine kinase
MQKMHKRAEENGARSSVISQGGTTVNLELPLPAGIPTRTDAD